MELPDAVVRFAWTYEGLTDGRTRMNQHLVMEGPGAEAYVPVMEQYFAPNVVQGMERLAEEVARYATGR
jgi:hypothetical protein